MTSVELFRTVLGIRWNDGYWIDRSLLGLLSDLFGSRSQRKTHNRQRKSPILFRDQLTGVLEHSPAISRTSFGTM